MNKLSSTDWNTVMRMLAGGALVGGGAGAAVTFANHLKELQNRAKPPMSDDDTLYLDIPAKQPVKAAAANSNTATTFALSGLAGLTGTALAYNAVRQVYNDMRRKQLDEDLSKAHHIYLNGQAQTKEASSYSLPTKAVGTGYLAVLLTALGSAVVANKMLQKRFPPIQSPMEGQPRKIVARTVDPVTRKPINEGMESSDTNPNAVEGLVRTQMSNTKMAAQNDLVTVVSALASGRCAEMKELIKIAGVDGMMAAIKGASCSDVNPVDRNLAVSLLAHDALLREALSPMIAAEFFKSAAWTFDVLPTLDDDQRYHLEGLVSAAGEAARTAALAPVMSKLAADESAVKQAEELTVSPLKTIFMAGALTSILDKHKDDPDHEEMARRDTVEGQNSPSSGPGAGPSHGVDMEVADDDALQFVRHHMSEIDKLRKPE